MDIHKILNDIKETAERLNRAKLQGQNLREMTLDGLLKYCETVESLCKEIQELEKEIQKRDSQVESLKAELDGKQ